MSDLPEIERLQAIELRPEDALVVTLPANVSMEQFEQFTDLLAQKFPGRKTLVVTREVDVEVIREAT